MLLSSVNSLDYALDIITNNKQNEIEIDKNTYKNLNQDENIEEINNSTAINFNEITEISSSEENNNNDINITSKKKREKKI